MSDFFKSLKRWAKAAMESFGPSRYVAADGIIVTCPHCKGEIFERRMPSLIPPLPPQIRLVE